METVILTMILVVCLMQLVLIQVFLVIAAKKYMDSKKKDCSSQKNDRPEPFEQESKEQRAAEQEMKLFQQGLANMLSYDGNASKRGAED